jgi:outer membrane lipoprotein-sorting protein
MKNMRDDRKCRLILSGMSVALAFLAGPAFAQKSTVPAIDPKAQEMLKQSAATYAALRSYSCEAETELKVDSLPGSRIIKIMLAFQKPNHAAVTVTKYGETQQFITDGKSLYLYVPDKKEYIQRDLPPDIPAVGPVLTQGQTFLGLTLMKPTGLAFMADTTQTRIASMTLGSPQLLNGVEVRTITRTLSRSDGGKMTFFITLGVKDHFLYRFADTIQSLKPLPMGEGSKAKRIDDTEIYTNIQADMVLPAADFLPPAGAKKITDTETK